MLKKLRNVLRIFAFLGLLVVSNALQAAEFESVYIRFDRMKVGESDPKVLLVLQPQTVAIENQLTVEFPIGFTVDSGCTVDTGNLPDGITPLPSSSTLACSGSGQTITITNVSDLTVSTAYGVNVVTGIDLPVTAGQYVLAIETLTAGSSIIDSSEVATYILTDDQIQITATVPPTFSFSLGANGDSFSANLDPSTITSTNGVTATLTTNAVNGWVAFLLSENQGLSSSITGDIIDTIGTVNDNATTTLITGTTGYVVDVDLTTDSATAGTGTVVIDPDYDHTGTNGGGTLSAISQLIASADGSTDGDVVTLIARASISGLIQAADDYTDTLTVVAAGNF